MCVDMGGGGGSHFRERGLSMGVQEKGGGSQGVHEKGGSQGVHKKGGSREPCEPPWLRAWHW